MAKIEPLTLPQLERMLNLIRFRAGQWVEVRSEEEILASLDSSGRLERLPFMPEMLEYCGRRFRISKTAHKTCDTIHHFVGRRMEHTVHLEDLRCDGQAHGGCQAGCLLFWKTMWLKPISRSELAKTSAQRQRLDAAASTKTCNRAMLIDATRAEVGQAKDSEARYACQATDLLKATAPLSRYNPWQYFLDLVLGNVTPVQWVKFGALAIFNTAMRACRRPWRQFPRLEGKAVGRTPTTDLGLREGELVEVRSQAEIMPTIGADRKNRGLTFDVEMLPYCGKRLKVLRRVERIIDEKSGKLITLPSGCLVLDGAVCSGNYSSGRLFCPRAVYPYWREIWLKRAGE